MAGSEPTIVSADDADLESEIPELAAVGSVMHHLSSKVLKCGAAACNARIANTGPSGLKFHAVRGPRKLVGISWNNGYTEAEVPEVYGDPALLLPEFYTPKVLPWMQ